MSSIDQQKTGVRHSIELDEGVYMEKSSKTNLILTKKKHNMEEIFRTVLDNDKYVICIGNQAVSSKRFDTNEDAWAYIDSKTWELIANLQVVIATNLWEAKKREPKNKKKS